MTAPDEPTYLQPYLRAAKKHRDGFSSLLWASPDTQQVRFEALTRLTDLHKRTVLDVGCGRADLLDYLRAQRIEPSHYVGIEAVPELVLAAGKKIGPSGLIVRGDFICEPVKLFVGAERVVISGALNTLDNADFFSSIKRCFEACAEVLVFNFLSTPLLAGLPYLSWHPKNEVIDFSRTLTSNVMVLDDYLEGDCTIALRRNLETE